MLRVRNVFLNQFRTYKGEKDHVSWKKDGVKYGKITYYPRFPNHVDPPVTPTKLLMVRRVKHYKYNPWWHKDILDKLQLNDKLSDIAIVKNTPDTCLMLWKIKHLIEVTPIEAPEKLPDPESCSTYLHENGKLLIAPKIDKAREQATLDFINDPKRMDRPYINDWLRRTWLSGWRMP